MGVASISGCDPHEVGALQQNVNCLEKERLSDFSLPQNLGRRRLEWVRFQG